MYARDFLLAAISDAMHPLDYVVLPYARALDGPAKTTVLMQTNRVTAQGPYNVFQVGLIVVSAKTMPGTADDDLDESLEEVLYALKKADLEWTEAVRATFGDQQSPAYEVTVLVRLSATDPTPTAPEEP